MSSDESSIVTSWGTLPLYTPEVSVEWWNNFEDGWGEWPPATKMELVTENRAGMWYDIGEYTVLIIPISSGKHVSRLSRNPQLKSCLESHLQLPVAGFEAVSYTHLTLPTTLTV